MISSLHLIELHSSLHANDARSDEKHSNHRRKVWTGIPTKIVAGYTHRLQYTEKNTGVYLNKTVVELTKIFIKAQPTTLVVELMNKIRKSHFVINLTNLFVNITKKIHYVNDAAFVDLTHLFVNPTKNFYKIYFFKIII